MIPANPVYSPADNVVGIAICLTLGGFNFWLVKANSLGELEWQRFYGEQGDDRGLSGIQTSDGGYAIAGYTNSGASSGSDILFIKTDDNGSAEFDQ